MQQLIQTKKKKKKKNSKSKKLLTSFSSLAIANLEATEKEIRDRLKNMFRFHIGEEDYTNPAEIMREVFSLSEEQLNSWRPYKLSFWWEVVKKVLRLMRRTSELFVINRGGRYFVLSNEKECGYYKKMLNRDIENMKASMKRAEEWVREKKYTKLFD